MERRAFLSLEKQLELEEPINEYDIRVSSSKNICKNKNVQITFYSFFQSKSNCLVVKNVWNVFEAFIQLYFHLCRNLVNIVWSIYLFFYIFFHLSLLLYCKKFWLLRFSIFFVQRFFSIHDQGIPQVLSIRGNPHGSGVGLKIQISSRLNEWVFYVKNEPLKLCNLIQQSGPKLKNYCLSQYSHEIFTSLYLLALYCNQLAFERIKCSVIWWSSFISSFKPFYRNDTLQNAQ